MWTWNFAAALALMGQMMLGTGISFAQNFPSKPIRFVTTSPGGSADIGARLVAQGLSGSVGQQVIVENRGGSSVIAAQIVAQAQPDGYTLLFFSDSIWILPFLQKNVGYDPVKDFAPVTSVGSAPTVLVVHPALPAKSVMELIALAKAKPGALNYSSGVAGGINHLAPEMFKAAAGVNITRIPFNNGAAAALNSVIAGEVQMMFPAVASGMPHVKTGRVRALAVTSAQPTELAPGIPTVAASGLPGFEATLILCVLAPAKTPAAVIAQLNREIGRIINGPEVKDRFFRAGIDIIASTPEQLAATMKTNMAKLGKVIKDAGIRGDSD